MTEPAHLCRACRSRSGSLVLDLGEQPACDYFPPLEDPGPDPVYRLEMWLCASCGLAQLVSGPEVAEEPRGREPAALVDQAAEAVEAIAANGLLRAGGRVAEFASPHGGSWLGLLVARGLTPVDDGRPADVVVDCFGMMHAADQAAALRRRVSQVAPGGVLLVQFHSLATIARCGQWNALRHGHYAYYSTTSLAGMLAGHGFVPRTAWSFELYGGTVLLAASREAEGRSGPDATVRAELDNDARAGVRDPDALRGLQRRAEAHADELHEFLVAERSAGRSVVGYGAASRTAAMLVRAGVDKNLLPAVVDASPAKWGLRMPGTDIAVVGPDRLTERPPASVLVFVPDLLTEVRTAFGAVEASGGRWVDAEALGA